MNYDEVGPGYLSAYGLVAAYNVVPGKNGRPDWDNGVRVHGSSEILSIRNPDAYSHGCHRLMNNLAVRMFSFVLRHRPVIIVGDKPLDFSRQFLWKEHVYEMRLPSRGFWYRLEPPVPVNVLEGNIIGTVKKPITVYVPKPGVMYPPGPPPSPKDSPEVARGRRRGAELRRLSLLLLLAACQEAPQPTPQGRRTAHDETAPPPAPRPSRPTEARRPCARSGRRPGGAGEAQPAKVGSSCARLRPRRW